MQFVRVHTKTCAGMIPAVSVIMNRRDSIRFGTLFGVAMALGKLDALKAEGGLLTVDLAQWEAVHFKYHGSTIAVSTAEVFKSLAEVTTLKSK